MSPIACFCGEVAEYHPVMRTARGDLVQEPMCPTCYAAEFPERAATFELARCAPNAGEFQDT